VWIPDFDPRCLIWNVLIKFPFSDNALKDFLAGQSEQALSILLARCDLSATRSERQLAPNGVFWEFP